MSLGFAMSVVVPTHSRALLLRDCLESLRRQTVPCNRYEIIVVDDASTDATPEVVRGLDLPATFHYVRQAHGGSSAARNRGLELAAGETVLFFDDDVVATPQLLEAHLEAHEKWGRGAVLGYTPLAPDLPKTPIMDYHRARWDHIFTLVEHQARHGELSFNHFITLNLSARRADLLALGPFDTTFNAAYEDTELGLRFAKAGVPLRFCPQALAYHRPNLDEQSLTVRQEQMGYRAGRYLCARPDVDLARAMNASYVLSAAAGEGARPSLRARLRHLLLSDAAADALFLTVTRSAPVLPRKFVFYLFSLLKWQYYGRGFRRALAEAADPSAVLRFMDESVPSPSPGREDLA